jgi:hypothetical protein
MVVACILVRESKMSLTMSLQDARKQFINSDKAWTKKEEEELTIEYTINEFDLLTLCFLHKRMPTSILNKLKKMSLIPARNEVRGWDLFTTTELYKSLSKNKAKRKKPKTKKPVIPESVIVPQPEPMKANVYVYPIKDKYQKIIDEMNEREEDLKYQIKYYRENSEQVLRIKEYERELEVMKGNIQDNFMRKQAEYITEVRHREYIDMCVKNFNTAFTTYKNKMISESYEESLKTDTQILITVEMPAGYHELMYRFTHEPDKNRCDINCDISTFVYNRDGKLVKELYTCRVNGTYTTDGGFRPFTTHDIIV